VPFLQPKQTFLNASPSSHPARPKRRNSIYPTRARLGRFARSAREARYAFVPVGVEVKMRHLPTLAVLTLLVLPVGQATAAEKVDLQLILAADVSRSILRTSSTSRHAGRTRRRLRRAPSMTRCRKREPE